MLPTPSEKLWLVDHESVGKLAAYSDSNSSHGIILAIFTQRLRADNLHPLVSSKSKGWRGASSAFLYRLAGGYGWVWIYFTCFSCTLLSFAQYLHLGHITCDRLFTKPELENLLVYRCQKIMEQHTLMQGLSCFHWCPKTRET